MIPTFKHAKLAHYIPKIGLLCIYVMQTYHTFVTTVVGLRIRMFEINANFNFRRISELNDLFEYVWQLKVTIVKQEIHNTETSISK